MLCSYQIRDWRQFLVTAAKKKDAHLKCLHRQVTLKFGCAKHRATAIIEAVRGPETPMVVRNSEMFGVRRKGTGRLASSSPVASLMSKRK